MSAPHAVIEELIDEHTLNVFLELVAQVCNEKAGHIQTNRQDVPLAKTWEQAARRIDAAGAFCEGVGI